MKRLNHIVAATLLLLCALINLSCTTELETQTPVIPLDGTTAEISFLADIPASMAVTTRSEVGTIVENTINDIYILVFKTSGTKELVYKSKGKNLTNASGSTNNNKVTFKATLPVGTEYTFMVLANAEAKLTNITVNASTPNTKTDVLNLVQSTSVGEKWDSSSPSIPMWGEKNITLTASSSPTFVLTRMLARVNLEFNPKVVANKDDFTLTSVRYYNYNTAGTLLSNDGNYTVDGSGVVTVTQPTLPTLAGTQTGSALLYDGTDITGNKECKNKIYIFEAAHNNNTYTTPANNSNWINNPCLVIGGKYKNGAETFYRIDFIKKDKTDPNNVKDIWLSILRNFSYNVTITEVSGEGYNSPDVALKSAPFNIEANVLNWHERDMGEIVFDGVFYLSVSRDEFVFQRNEVTTKQAENSVFIKTDYLYNSDKLNAKSGWKVERYEHINGTEMTSAEKWLTLVPGTGAPDVKTEAYFTFKANTGTTNREANVWISAGRLRYKIHIVQRVLSLDILNSANAPISDMLFVVPRTGDRTHTPIPFNVVWTPINQSVAITTESPQVWNPFAPAWLTPNPSSAGWQIAAGSTQQTYSVKPPTVSDTELGTDPFYQKESTYHFEVVDGSDSEKKGITLRQIYYNIIADTYAYRLDGKTYTINVRSNTEWKITKIEEWLYNVDPTTLPAGERPATPVMLQLKNFDNLRVGTSGGFNVNGESVAFTVVNKSTTQHKNKWGTVYVTIESPDGKVPTQRIALRFPRTGLTLLGLGYARDVRGFNVAFPSTYHLQSLNRMLSSTRNFGNLENSVVQVNEFNIVGYNCEGASYAGSTTINWNKGDLKLWLNKHQPDIIAIAYSMIFDANEAALLKQYLDHGGAVIMYYGGDGLSTGNVNTVMSAIFNKTFSDSEFTLDGTSYVYKYENVDDPILNGPFGDIRNKNYGIHITECNMNVSKIQTEIKILGRVNSRVLPSTSTSLNVNIFRHKTLNFFWVGNGMGTSTYYTNVIDQYYDVNRLDDSYRPTARLGFWGPGGVGGVDIYNSYMFANAMAWAIGVSNHQPPAGGY